ncbi:sigma-70 family RNA polymerase sigma factor [Nannocystis sp.]|uniref:RNA polymerase sigma factor n=1 Tax=Nannocystis sp. TaxID=1962667 RepID=UPI0025DD5675|nr:sigma-70 family RNA polymerase sigma factor [Nannocystis sp.]MBK7827364.1 sigma-70 family RNA polymerase sigma factor [Nannocystis sp.]
MDSDAALLASWRGGDQRAGRALFARHVDGVSRFFFSKVSSGVDDLVQRSFLGLLERSAEIPSGVVVRAYLFGIARNLLLRRFRDEYRDGRYIDELTTSVADLGITPSVLHDQRKQLALLYSALQALPLDLQIAVELFYWEELAAGEIGSVLGVPEGTVRSRLRRARELLAQQLQTLGPGLGEPSIEDIERWARELRDRIGRP